MGRRIGMSTIRYISGGIRMTKENRRFFIVDVETKERQRISMQSIVDHFIGDGTGPVKWNKDNVDLDRFAFEMAEIGYNFEIWKGNKLMSTYEIDCNTRKSGLPSFVVKDSGARQEFESGAVRDTSGDKPRPDLISPFFLERLGTHLRKGAAKYDTWNWAKGIPNSRCFESCMRHLIEYAQGMRDEDHLAAAAFNIMAIIHNEEVVRTGATLAPKVADLVDMPKFIQHTEKEERD